MFRRAYHAYLKSVALLESLRENQFLFLGKMAKKLSLATL